MPTFRAHVSYFDVNWPNKLVKEIHETSLDTPEDVRKAAISKYRALAQDGIVYVDKIKRVR